MNELLDLPKLERRLLTGALGWALMGLVIAGWDASASVGGPLETMSAAFSRAPKAVTIPLTVYLVGHLFKLIPSQYDPLEWIGDGLSAAWQGGQRGRATRRNPR